MFFMELWQVKVTIPECIGDVFVFLCDDYIKCFSAEH